MHRDHARKMIRRAVAGQLPTKARAPREPVFTYSEAVIDALATCWAVLDGPTGKRLRPALPTLVAALVRHGELPADPAVIDALLAITAATMDRRLKGHRLGLVAAKGRSMTRPGSLLKSSIPLKTWHEWDDTAPGCAGRFGQPRRRGQQRGVPLHPGRHRRGQRLDRGDHRQVQRRTHRRGRLEQLRVRFPFAVLGIHSDNGSEFINHHLARWCTDRQITFTRGRADHKNDQAHVEQKNWTQVRRSAGYLRYDTPRELDLLNQMWTLQSQLDNLYLPQQKLLTKTRIGAKVTKTYDPGATPYTRLTRDHPDLLDPHDQRHLDQQVAALNPAQLRRDIALIQANLLELARRSGPVQQRAKRNATYLNKTKISPPAKRAKPDESTTQPKRAS